VDVIVQRDEVQRQSVGAGWLAMWHLLSLDAPAVAAVWTWFVARAAHVALPAVVPVAMFVAVWLLYAGDRLLDGLAGGEGLEERHRFHRRHGLAFGVAMGVAAVLLAPLVAAIPREMLRLYVGLAGMLAVWFLAVHLIARRGVLTLPKELMPGVFCAAAAFIPVWADIGVEHRRLAVAALAYGLLVTQNCLWIYAWEHEDAGGTAAHATTRWGLRWLRPLGVVTMVLPVAAMPFAGIERVPILIAVAAAAAGLFALDRIRAFLDPTDLRAAADFVLLTPLLVVALVR
jgi:hypothetical protein